MFIIITDSIYEFEDFKENKTFQVPSKRHFVHNGNLCVDEEAGDSPIHIPQHTTTYIEFTEAVVVLVDTLRDSIRKLGGIKDVWEEVPHKDSGEEFYIDSSWSIYHVEMADCVSGEAVYELGRYDITGEYSDNAVPPEERRSFSYTQLGYLSRTLDDALDKMIKKSEGKLESNQSLVEDWKKFRASRQGE